MRGSRRDASSTRSTEDWLSQIRRGLLELCVLALIARRPSYGYEIVTELTSRGALATREGTIYPLLRRLRRDALLDTYWVESSSGPPRQYYRLTAAGQRHLTRLRAAWNTIVADVGNTLAQEEQP